MTVLDQSQAYALELNNVEKSFGAVRAVKGVSLKVAEGTVLALLGPNGAGKTTTIEMCEGFQKPTSGSIRVLGLDPTSQPDQVRAQVGIMPQDSGSYSGIKVAEMLHLSASYNADPLDPEWLLNLVGLDNVRSTTYRRLSGGQKQRLSLALALISRPRLVFLDEPTAGMDAQSRLLVWELIKQLRADGVTVVLTTHVMDEAQALADHVVIMDHGEIVAEGSCAQLQHATAQVLRFETDRDLDLSLPLWQELGVEALRPRVYVVRVQPDPDVVARVAAAAATARVLISSLSTDSRSLEDVFLDLTGRELRS
ncbi:MAG: ABC transporter ATP-binding protein [Corynebacterium sp.]|uniref:ABC transporter ATP-binding protein n=1 Tax=Corynebacterium sp. TaxID=1720 RepID=UPI0026DCA7CE|nr:ABC transporter ATP-binding protein [Corynebacterium sp.]MDO4760388.1 ABC transporter ATP-binding protein [Corynebacterium sp.]